MAKNTRRNRKNSRRNRKANRKSRRQNRRALMYGGAPAPVNYSLAASDPAMQSLAQGGQYEAINKNFHGGASLVGGPYPAAVADPTILPESLRASARVLPLDGAIAEVSGLKDPGTVSGGGRKSRKNRKANRKNRKNSRKANRKSRKANRKNRKSRRNYRGGAYSLENAGPFSMTRSDMLLSPELEAKALQGMNSEWKLAENPQAFAPGYKSY